MVKVVGIAGLIPTGINQNDKMIMEQRIREMSPGDIMVAKTTGPERIVACKKAGGIISHAAIISRELGIPSIVNTKVGTCFI